MSASSFEIPPVPLCLAHCPTAGGLVVPFTSLRHRNGDVALGLADSERVSLCLRERRCGVCGRIIGGRVVFLVRQVDLDRGRSSEPGMCPPCAAYAQRACPMVAGRMEHYRRALPQFLTRTCADPQCTCRVWAAPSGTARYGARAVPGW
jgi:hypothetical protein